jgi:hypothetical protein
LAIVCVSSLYPADQGPGGIALIKQEKRFSPVQEATLSNKETIDLSARRRYDDENICRDLNRGYENKFPSRSGDHIPGSLQFHIE